MTIKVKGIVVVDDNRNIGNVVNFAATGEVSGSIIATKTQAEEGTLNTKLMTPQRVKEAITSLLPEEGGDFTVIKAIRRGSTSFSGSTPVTVGLGITINANRAFISSSVRSNITYDQSQFIESITGSYPGQSYTVSGVVGSAAAATASVRFQNESGNNTNIIVQGGSGVTYNQIDWRGQIVDTLTLSAGGVVEWEVIEFN